MKRTLSTLILALFATAAFATPPKPTPTPAGGGDAAAIAAAIAVAVQQQVQVQLQAMQQTQTAKTGDVDIDIVTGAGNGGKRPVSSAIAPSMSPTSICAIPVSGGFAVANISASGGSAFESDTCITIEISNAAVRVGDTATAVEALCTLPKFRASRKKTGKPCIDDQATTGGKTAAEKPWMTDPLARKRDGLAPL